MEAQTSRWPAVRHRAILHTGDSEAQVRPASIVHQGVQKHRKAIPLNMRGVSEGS